MSKAINIREAHRIEGVVLYLGTKVLGRRIGEVCQVRPDSGVLMKNCEIRIYYGGMRKKTVSLEDSKWTHRFQDVPVSINGADIA